MQSSDSYGRSDDTRLANLAFRQHGVVALLQLLALGYTERMICSRVRKGQLHRLYRGVYAVGHVRLTYRGHWLAAVMACGSGALLSHRAAAALHDLRTVPVGLIDVAAPTRHAIAGVRCHFVREIHPEDMTRVDGIPVTSIERTTLDQAEVLGLQQLRTLLEAIQRRGLFDLNGFAAMIVRNRGRHGLHPLRQALDQLADDPPWTQSQLERRFLELIREQGFPEPQANVIVHGKLVDLYWQDHRVVVELDSWTHHRQRPSFDGDRRQDTKMVVAGLRPIRVTQRHITHERADLLADLRRLLSAVP